MSFDAKITFIVPTIGRATLTETIQSIANQTCGGWKAIIIFDGIPPTIIIDDPRFQILHIANKVERPPDQTNSAGYVRNYGIQFATTEWVGFVDDDDTIRNTYVETFFKEIAEYENDVVIFRMVKFGQGDIKIKRIIELIDANVIRVNKPTEQKYRAMDPETTIYINTNTIFPLECSMDLKEGDVGISFAAKKRIFDSGIQFNTGCLEDFEFLNTVQKNGNKMMISPFIMYFVKGLGIFNDVELDRVFINHSR
jgi:glycosyltransferase involved in cell wall biosynthesis